MSDEEEYVPSESCDGNGMQCQVLEPKNESPPQGFDNGAMDFCETIIITDPMMDPLEIKEEPLDVPDMLLNNENACETPPAVAGELCTEERGNFGDEATITNQTGSPISFIEKVSDGQFDFIKFNSKNFDKKDIIKQGRPRPDIGLIEEKRQFGRMHFRYFNSEMYENYKWLCGCDVKKALFCWPCLLFDQRDANHSPWVTNGYSNLNNFSNAAKRHEKTPEHIGAFYQLHCFGETRIDNALNKQKQVADSRHNEEVRKNLEILKKLIDVVCLLGRQELAFREGQNGEKNFFDCGNYAEILHLLAKRDTELKNHLDTRSVFIGPDIRNDIVESVRNVLLKNIKEEVENSPFVAILLNEMTDVRTRSRLSTVVRYTANGRVHEAFLNLEDAGSESRTSNGLFQHIKSTIEELNAGNKFIAATYDGAATPTEEMKCLQKSVSDTFPTVLFAHRLDYGLSLTLEKSACEISDCRSFFLSLSGLAAFFRESKSTMTARTKFLDDFVDQEKIPAFSIPTRWDFPSGTTISIVRENWATLQEFFKLVAGDEGGEFDEETFRKGMGLSTFLSEKKTIFLLEVFHRIFSFSDRLDGILRNESSHVVYCHKMFEKTVHSIMKERKSFWEIWSKVKPIITATDSSPPPKRIRKRKKSGDDDDNDDAAAVERSLVLLFDRIINKLCDHLEIPLNNYKEYEYAELLNPKNFCQYRVNFPKNIESYLYDLKNSPYKKFFNFSDLRSELFVFYDHNQNKFKAMYEMCDFLAHHNLEVVMPQIHKLVNLIVTTPLIEGSVEGSFSALKRIKNYERSTMGQEERLPGLAMLSVEKERLLKMEEDSGKFYEAIISEFLQISKLRTNFIYK